MVASYRLVDMRPKLAGKPLASTADRFRGALIFVFIVHVYLPS
jgi:hypothetical protein